MNRRQERQLQKRQSLHVAAVVEPVVFPTSGISQGYVFGHIAVDLALEELFA